MKHPRMSTQYELPEGRSPQLLSACLSVVLYVLSCIHIAIRGIPCCIVVRGVVVVESCQYYAVLYYN